MRLLQADVFGIQDDRMTFPFATAPRSFSRGKRVYPDGAYWAHRGILECIPPFHLWGLDWQRCFESLGAALARHELRRLEMHVARQGWAASPLARRDSPTVRQEVERPTGAAAQPAVDPGSTPGESDNFEPTGGVTSCWPCNGTGCDRCMPPVEVET